MDDWFTLERIDEDTDILSEYRHWEETHCYLLRGLGGPAVTGRPEKQNDEKRRNGPCSRTRIF